ncbi:EVE domain-containing protein [Crucibulum laeve]|uniref:EVE domain-containing protein n=1 Tax=Crucibulum laeve TaxID=68775 RepID=A0A5C3MGZ2_9AGAR|nr:EVE domain-containing protein [Crucibulum laeve]
MSTVKKYWLLKAEPDSRIVKGKDVKFSVDDFESIKTSPWEGVRNYEARNLMKEMKVGEKALFYHSNCKTPGIAGFAEVSKEAYPDYTAWDPSHPYYDAVRHSPYPFIPSNYSTQYPYFDFQKTDKSNPRWYMVELTFSIRAKNFVSLALLKHIAESSSLSKEIEYIGEDGAKAIKGMDLVTRGRLSVQRVDEGAWNSIQLLAEKGGWDEMDLKPKKVGAGGNKTKAKEKPGTSAKASKSSAKVSKGKKVATQSEQSKEDDNNLPIKNYEEDSTDQQKAEKPKFASKLSSRKRKANDDLGELVEPPRRSTRTRK